MTEPVLPPKLDPETLVLRAKPRRAVRFRRNLLIGVGAVGALALAGVTWIGLSPPVIKAVETAEKAGDPQARVRQPTETLSALPKTYTDVPQLGPPLPGDLGGPMLEAQQAKVAVESSDGSVPPPSRSQAGQSQPPLNPVNGGLFVSGAVRAPEVISNLAATVAAKLETPAGATVSAGTVIAATLITGLNSDLPGVVLAQVTETVRDSRTGREVVIPAGSRLIGRYERATGARQARINVRWEKLVLPDGRSLALMEALAADEAGYVGLRDRVDYHPGQLAKGVGLSTILGLADTRSEGGGDDLSRAIREAAGRTFNQAGQRIVQQAVDAPATITVRPGWPIRVILIEDFVLPLLIMEARNG
ncbi:TrbI/VirB10 family protein [Asticcacaulis sp. AND118]|uniref:TrbI/VirB10 family protein n=1 Tax=Asticcacaulis sp. AND118 TaxID=2840468 RepID=UPI001D001171|nr:TrbI/VirB10 family protein [Asticcacaulis sp. AND118]UDF04853.1 conjugal transfer protein TrbI [Asticcacaulis sp. AND118]